jgi:hypothetical protein
MRYHRTACSNVEERSLQRRVSQPLSRTRRSQIHCLLYDQGHSLLHRNLVYRTSADLTRDRRGPKPAPDAASPLNDVHAASIPGRTAKFPSTPAPATLRDKSRSTQRRLRLPPTRPPNRKHRSPPRRLAPSHRRRRIRSRRTPQAGPRSPPRTSHRPPLGPRSRNRRSCRISRHGLQHHAKDRPHRARRKHLHSRRRPNRRRSNRRHLRRTPGSGPRQSSRQDHPLQRTLRQAKSRRRIILRLLRRSRPLPRRRPQSRRRSRSRSRSSPLRRQRRLPPPSHWIQFPRRHPRRRSNCRRRRLSSPLIIPRQSPHAAYSDTPEAF